MASIRTLYRLQTIDQALTLAQGRLQEIEERLRGDEETRTLQRLVDSLANQVSHLRTKLRDLELENQGISEKMIEVQNRLYGGRVTNPRELSSLQDELGYLSRRQKQQEDRVLDVMLQLDEQAEDLESRSDQLAQASGRWETLQLSLRAEQAELEAQVSQLRAQRAAIRGTLQAEELSTYDRLRQRKNGLAVVLLQGQACGGCGVGLSTSMLQQVRQADVMQFCTNCGRILSVR